jgi:diguanylate cyclase
MRVRPQLFDSRIARRIFGLFLVASLVPLFVVALWLAHRVGGEVERHANEQIAAATRSYGRVLLEKLLAVTAALPAGDAQTLSPVAEWTAAAIVRGGDVTARIGEWPVSPASIHTSADEPTVALVGSAGRYDVVIARPSGESTVLAVVDPEYLWQTKDILARGMEVCVLGEPKLHGLVQCSSPIPEGTLATLEAARRTSASGKLSWSLGGDDWLAAYWQLFVPSRFAGESLTIVVSQPRDVALESLGGFYLVVAQAAVLTFALIFLLAGAQIRRTLEPLGELLRGTRRIAAQDFTTPVRIAAGDEFGDVGGAMNAMSAQLNHQFASLRALADIDRLILETAAIETVLGALLERLRTLVPHGEHLVLRIDSDDPNHGRIYRATGTEPLTLDRVVITNNLREWLAAQVGGNATRADLLARHGVAAGQWPADACVHVAPMRVGETVVGALIAVDAATTPFTAREMDSIRELAVRVSVAVAAGNREAELFRRAHFDALTGLPNRDLLDDRLRQAVAQAHRDERRLAVLFIDLDGFKEINDTLGHRSGDELLKETGLRLSVVLRDADTVARLGGDEYAIVLPQVHSALEAEAVAIKVVESLKRPFAIDGREVFVSASVGIAIFPEDGSTAEELLRRADMAMYGAKDAGKSCYRFFAHEMDEQIQERHTLHHALRHALDAGQFFLAYQPQREFATHRFPSVEALLRWRHPERGLVSPALFVPILEETGLIGEVGLWVLRRALADFAQWRAQGLPFERVAVNVSARQLQEWNFAETVIATLDAAGLEGHHLEVEITEASVIANFRAANDTLARLLRHGVKIALDDFGTGYSSLAYLNELEFDTLKIDRAFVANLPADKSVAIVKAIIAVAGTLGKHVVAEGIETESQYRKLAALGCDLGQGYLLCRPLEAPKLEAWIRSVLAAGSVGDNTSRIWRPTFGKSA